MAKQSVAKSSDHLAYGGSFPSDFVDFQNYTGQLSYWSTSGGRRGPYRRHRTGWNIAENEHP